MLIKGEKLNSGSFGIVYSVSEDGTTFDLVLKRNIIPPVDIDGNEVYQSESGSVFSLRELDILCKTRDHPNMVCVDSIAFDNPFTECLSPPIDINGYDDKIHFILEKADYTLQDYIYKENVNFKKIKKYLVQTLLGLEYLHKMGIIHRDINILNNNKELPIEDWNTKFYAIAMKFIVLNDKTNFELALYRINENKTTKSQMQIIQAKFLEAKLFDLAERVASWW